MLVKSKRNPHKPAYQVTAVYLYCSVRFQALSESRSMHFQKLFLCHPTLAHSASFISTLHVFSINSCVKTNLFYNTSIPIF